MAEDNAGQRLHLDIADAFALDAGEIAHLGLGKLDIGKILAAQGSDAGVDFILCEAIAFAIPAIEFDRKFAHGGVAAFFDIRQNGFHRLAHLPVGRGSFRRSGGFLEIVRHVTLPVLHSNAMLDMGPGRRN